MAGSTLRAQNRRFPSPLRYPGGKGGITNFVKLVLIENNLVGADYIEPYAGGASVALSLLTEGYAGTIYINDVDPAVYAFWNAVLTETERLCARINDTTVNVGEWSRQRAVQRAADPDPLDLAFSTFFMNRTNRSGIITGGIIGGRDQSGPWKLDARYNREDLIRRIRKVARHSSRIFLSRLDAKDFLEPWCSELEAGFVYLDPPYYTKGGDLYRNHYGPSDHLAVAKVTNRLKVPWIVSYDDHPNINELYKSQRSMRYGLSYSAGTRGSGQEVMFFSSRLRVPKVESPARLADSAVDARLASTVVGRG